MKNIVYIIIAMFCSIQLTAQEFSSIEQERMISWNLNHAYLMQQNKINELRLREILDIERKRKNNLVMGTGFAGLGLVFLTGGGLILSQNGNCKDGHICENVGQVIVGGGLIAIGTLEVGVSLPLFISSIKRKRKRNQMIEELKREYPTQ